MSRTAFNEEAKNLRCRITDLLDEMDAHPVVVAYTLMDLFFSLVSIFDDEGREIFLGEVEDVLNHQERLDEFRDRFMKFVEEES